MRRTAVVLAVAVASSAGCTSVKLAQRDGCWVRQTEKWPGRVTEELGPCAAPEPEWADDRMTRVVQECVARADHRWQTAAMLAWSRGEPLPERGSDAALFQECMNEPARALAGENDQLRRKNDEMKEHLGDVARERDALRTSAEQERAQRQASEEKRLAAQERMADRLLSDQEKMADHLATGQARMAEHLATGQEKMAGYLGEAAKKSSQPAVATATSTSRSDGAATTDSSATAPVPAAVMAARPAGRTAAVRRARVRPGPMTATACEPAVCAPPALDAATSTGPAPETSVKPALPAAVTPAAGSGAAGEGAAP